MSMPGNAVPADSSDSQQPVPNQAVPSTDPLLQQPATPTSAYVHDALDTKNDKSDGQALQSQNTGMSTLEHSQPQPTIVTDPPVTTPQPPAESSTTDAQPPIYSFATSQRPPSIDPEKIEQMPPQSQPSASGSSANDVEKATTTSAAVNEPLEHLDPTVPPPLNYTLRTRKAAIAIFWSLILIDSIAIPLVLYFCLHYLTSLSPNTVFSISTACLGGISIIEYFLRFWRLWRHNSTCRVIGARRWYLDWFHWNFSAAWIFIMAELIVGTSPDYPPIRLLAMPLSSLCYWFSLSLLIQEIMRIMNMPSPIRISSVPKGEPLRPGIYSIIEDICAVDGSGGTEFRQRLNARFEASHYFRQMLHRLTLVWAIGMLAIAIATTVLIFTLNNEEIAYILGWTVPFVWAGFLTLWTFYYVKRCLKREYAKWRAEQKVG